VINRFIEEMTGAGEIAPYPYQNALTRDVRDAALAQERAELVNLWSGQAVALAKPLPSAEIVASLVREARAADDRIAAVLNRTPA